jgi:hypothetical protein
MANPNRPGRAPMTEEEIRAAWVREPPRLARRIKVADYDPAWPGLFQREAERIRAVLGQRVVRLEHVGSTAVPGLAAKPVIDILLVVPDSGDEPAYVSDLEAAGYVLFIREPDWHQHRCFKGPDTNIQLHVYEQQIEAALADRYRLSGAVLHRHHLTTTLHARRWDLLLRWLALTRTSSHPSPPLQEV